MGQPLLAVDSRLPEASHPAGCIGSLPRGRPAAWVRAAAPVLGWGQNVFPYILKFC